MNKLIPRPDGEPIPPGTLLFRIGANTDVNQEAIDRRKALEMFFNPSSRDWKSPGKRLSVWVEELTIADQAWAIMGSNPKRTVVACINVDDILAVEPPVPFHRLTRISHRVGRHRVPSGT